VFPDGSPQDSPLPGPGVSCRALLAANPALSGQDGQYVIKPAEGPAAELKVWCDMSTDQGGWTLVARSGIGTPAAWGWQGGTGGLAAEDAAPYSLDVGLHPLAFTQILVGALDTGTRTWGANVYRFEVPATFVVDYAAAPYKLAIPVAIKGDCQPNDKGGFMFAHAGFTSRQAVFFFRDHPEFQGFGLTPNKFALADDTGWGPCQRNGNLANLPGMIMVR
jgi:hypothetical protein